MLSGINDVDGRKFNLGFGIAYAVRSARRSDKVDARPKLSVRQFSHKFVAELLNSPGLHMVRCVVVVVADVSVLVVGVVVTGVVEIVERIATTPLH